MDITSAQLYDPQPPIFLVLNSVLFYGSNSGG